MKSIGDDVSEFMYDLSWDGEKDRFMERLQSFDDLMNDSRCIGYTRDLDNRIHVVWLENTDSLMLLKFRVRLLLDQNLVQIEQCIETRPK